MAVPRRQREAANVKKGLEVVLNGHVLPRDMTLFAAVARYSPALDHIRNDPSGLTVDYQDEAVWNKNHKFELVVV